MGLQRFTLGLTGRVRGAIVSLDEPWQLVLSRRAQSQLGGYPPPVQQVLGEMAAAAVLMHSTIKFDGSLILQLQGNGIMPLAVVEVQSDFGFRATAKLRGNVSAACDLAELMQPLQDARCAVTLEPRLRVPGQQPYQGVVPLQGQTDDEPPLRVQHVLQHYMTQSEQLPTTLVLAADASCAVGLLLQRMPDIGGNESVRQGATSTVDAAEDYARARLLAATLRHEEMLTLDVDTMMHRLFWNEPLQQLADEGVHARQPHFACRCSVDRVRGMVRQLGAEEAQAIVAEQGDIHVTCEFCFAEYRLPSAEVEQLFAETD